VPPITAARAVGEIWEDGAIRGDLYGFFGSMSVGFNHPRFDEPDVEGDLLRAAKAKVAKQEATFARQQEEIQALTASLKEQASQIQKVSVQLEVSKPAPQMVTYNP
jgi:septal ring factor EnvC (AmiA/AmiB activator)